MRVFKELREVNKVILDLENKRNSLANEFFGMFPMDSDMQESVPTVIYNSEEYIVTNVDIEELLVMLETDPYTDQNKVNVVSFEIFAKLYKESYHEHNIVR